MHRSLLRRIVLAAALPVALAMAPVGARSEDPKASEAAAAAAATAATAGVTSVDPSTSLAPIAAAAPAQAAAAETGTAVPPPVGSAELLPPPPPPPPVEEPYPRWGVFLGAGVPQAAQLSLIWRPLPFLRLHGGPSYDYLGFGGHAGLTLSPLRWWITPTLTGEVGQFSTFDVTRVVSGIDAKYQGLLKRVSVRYAAALLGFEFGSQRGFAFDLRVGLTYLEIDSRGSASFAGGSVSSGGSSGNDLQLRVTDPKIRGTAPTAQLGFQYFF